MAAEYQCFYLDPRFKLAHDESATPLLETNCLAEACGFVYDLYQREGRAVAVYQPRTQGYREIYRKRPHDGQPRINGRFASRTA